MVVAGISVEIEKLVALIRLQEPETMNALSPTIKAGLESEIPALIKDPGVKALVITGVGKAFCAGGDIRNMHQDRSPLATKARLERNWLWALPLMTTDKPVLMAINGAAAGAGFALAMMGDFRYCAPQAQFKAGFPGLGAVPDMGLGYTLPRAVGQTRATDILLTNRTVDATEAERIGLVTKITPAETLLTDVVQLARQLAHGPTVGLGLTKTILRRSFDDSLEHFLEMEAKAQALAFSTEDFTEGVAAFLEKRKATFKGR